MALVVLFVRLVVELNVTLTVLQFVSRVVNPTVSIAAVKPVAVVPISAIPVSECVLGFARSNVRVVVPTALVSVRDGVTIPVAVVVSPAVISTVSALAADPVLLLLVARLQMHQVQNVVQRLRDMSMNILRTEKRNERVSVSLEKGRLSRFLRKKRNLVL